MTTETTAAEVFGLSSLFSFAPLLIEGMEILKSRASGAQPRYSEFLVQRFAEGGGADISTHVPCAPAPFEFLLGDLPLSSLSHVRYSENRAHELADGAAPSLSLSRDKKGKLEKIAEMCIFCVRVCVSRRWNRTGRRKKTSREGAKKRP